MAEHVSRKHATGLRSEQHVFLRSHDDDAEVRVGRLGRRSNMTTKTYMTQAQMKAKWPV